MGRIIVTGSEGIIGRELVRYFVDQGKAVDRVDMDLGHDLLDNEYLTGGFARLCAGANYLVNAFGLNDHVTASRSSGTNPTSLSRSDLRDYHEVNVGLVHETIRVFIEHCRQPKSIVNFASLYGVGAPIPQMYSEAAYKHVGYTTSKHAVVGLTKHWAVYLAPRGIRVNAVVPGGLLASQSSEFLVKYAARCPMGRMMDPEEICGPVDFLASEMSTYVTGSILTVDGGWTAI